jgi:hypothetical protein
MITDNTLFLKCIESIFDVSHVHVDSTSEIASSYRFIRIEVLKDTKTGPRSDCFEKLYLFGSVLSKEPFKFCL